MLTKIKFAVAALLVLGIASVAQAGSRDDPDPSGGYGVGPLGQSLGHGVNTIRDNGREAFGLVAPHRVGRRMPDQSNTISSDGKCWVNTTNGNYAWMAC
jgi:hypothetical protein